MSLGEEAVAQQERVCTRERIRPHTHSYIPILSLWAKQMTAAGLIRGDYWWRGPEQDRRGLGQGLGQGLGMWMGFWLGLGMVEVGYTPKEVTCSVNMVQ